MNHRGTAGAKPTTEAQRHRDQEKERRVRAARGDSEGWQYRLRKKKRA